MDINNFGEHKRRDESDRQKFKKTFDILFFQQNHTVWIYVIIPFFIQSSQAYFSLSLIVSKEFNFNRCSQLTHIMLSQFHFPWVSCVVVHAWKAGAAPPQNPCELLPSCFLQVIWWSEDHLAESLFSSQWVRGVVPVGPEWTRVEMTTGTKWVKRVLIRELQLGTTSLSYNSEINYLLELVLSLAERNYFM